jgi:hypothetical protein
MARSTKPAVTPIRKAKPVTDPVGVSGLKRWGNRGMIWEEFLPELRGLRGVKKYKEMWDNDDVVGAVVYIVSVVLRGVKWDVQGENEEDVAFLNSCLEDMRPGWSNFIAEVLSMIVYGWSWHEIIYKRRAGDNADESRSSKFSDGKIGWARWDIRSQDSLNEWVWDPAGNLIAMAQQCPPDYRVREIPLSRSLLFRPTSYKNSPEGRSLLRSAYTAWYYKRNIENFRAIGIERDLTGLPVCRMDGATAATLMPDGSTLRDSMERIMRSIKNDEQGSLILPLVRDEQGNELVIFELMSSPGQKTFDVNAAIQQYSAKIATCLCADFLQLGHEKVGSLALSSDKTDMFALSLKAILDAIAEPINDYAIPRLLRLNGRSTENLPRISYGDIETPDLNALGGYMERINATGMPLWPNRALEDRLLTSANLPLPTEDERAEQAMAPTDPNPPEGL